jgi:hypothetical protein
MTINKPVHEKRIDYRRITNFDPLSLLALSASISFGDDCAFEQPSSPFTTNIAKSVHEKVPIIFYLSSLQTVNGLLIGSLGTG